MYNVEQRLIIITEWISLAEDCVKRYHYQLFISFRITVSLKTLRFSLPASINLWREYNTCRAGSPEDQGRFRRRRVAQGTR